MGRVWSGPPIHLDRSRRRRGDVGTCTDTCVRDARTHKTSSRGFAMSTQEYSWKKMTARWSWLFLLIIRVLTWVVAVPVFGATLEAGVAQVDITPPPGLPMYGYLDRLRKHQVAISTLDPLYARVLVLQGGLKRAALVTLDLGRTFNQSWLDRLHNTAKQTSQIDELIVTASHTHSGPNVLGVYPDCRLPAWENAALDKVVEAIPRAALHLEPVRLGSASGVAYIGHNRRHINPDNSVT